MAETTNDDMRLPHETRKLVVKGRLYHTATGNICSRCSAADRTMYVKIKIADGHQVVLECPVCDYTITVKDAMVNYNLNNPIPI